MPESKKQSLFLSNIRKFEKRLGFQTEIKWTVSLIVLVYHIVGAYWCFKYALPVKWQTVIFACIMYVFSGFGITGAVHRYWTHRTFKATTPLRIIFVIAFASAWQMFTIDDWVRYHRIHHKYSDTESDPHNSGRGLFYSHIGWVLMKKRPEVMDKFEKIDMTDIDNDPIVKWHKRYVYVINPLACFVAPTLINIFLLGEIWRVAVAWQCFIRLTTLIHFELTVNSLAHSNKTGGRHYNRLIKPVEHVLVSTLTLGEGWHNYHHAFPFDYKASEWTHTLDVTTKLLNIAEKLGWVSEKREASKEMIQNYKDRQHELETEFSY